MSTAFDDLPVVKEIKDYLSRFDSLNQPLLPLNECSNPVELLRQVLSLLSDAESISMCLEDKLQELVSILQEIQRSTDDDKVLSIIDGYWAAELGPGVSFCA